jgi:hypothetical protein
MGGNMKFFLLVLLIFCSIDLTESRASQVANSAAANGVHKGKQSLEILGKVVAHDRDGGISIGGEQWLYMDVFIVKIVKKLSGEISTSYLRVDLLGDLRGGDSQSRLRTPLLEKTIWKMKLEPAPPNDPHLCAYTIQSHIGPGELLVGPQIVPVADATDFPDPNGLQCYALMRKNIQAENTENK